MSRPSNDRSPKAWLEEFSALNRVSSTSVAYWSAVLFMAGWLIFSWFAREPNYPVYGLFIAIWTFVLGPGVAMPVMLRLPPRWLRVPAGESALHRILGVGVFGWILNHSGYNRWFVLPHWGRSINRAGLPFRALAARIGTSAHGACFAIHIVLAALVFSTGHPSGALWILLPGAAVHLYPVLLQRSILLRLQPLLDRAGSRSEPLN